MVIGTKDGVFTDNLGWIMIACNLFRATYLVDDFNCVRSMVEPNTFIPRPHPFCTVVQSSTCDPAAQRFLRKHPAQCIREYLCN